MAAPIRIPDAHRPAVSLLAGLDNESWAKLRNALANSKTLYTKELKEDLSGVIDAVSAGEAETLVQALVSMSFALVSHDWAPQEMAKAISDSQDLNLDEAAKGLLSTRLSELLIDNRLSLVAKTAAIVTSHERIFHTARILSDVRPVFGQNPSEGPIAATIVHTLRLDYFHAGGDDSLYVVLDEENLKHLGAEADRALAKRGALEEMLQGVGVKIYSTAEED